MCSRRLITELNDRVQSRSSPNGCLRLPRKPSIGKVTRDIDQETLTCACSFRCSNALREWMLFAAEKTFHDPRPFGRALGLSEGTIQDIMRDYPNNSREERTQMLTQWIEDKGETATAHRLIEVILSSDAGCLDDAATAEVLCQKLKELEPQIKEKLAARANGSPMSNSPTHVYARAGGSRQSLMPKRTSEAWHRLLVYAGSEAFQVDAVKRRADVHSQVIKADKEKLLLLESAVSRLQDEVCQLKLELKKIDDLQKTMKNFSYQVTQLQARLESKGEKTTAGSGSDRNPRTKPAKPIPPPKPMPKRQQLKKHYSYEELKVTMNVKKVFPSEIDRAHLEVYLSAAEFVELFGMTYQEFQDKPRWRQDELKKQAKLF